MDTDINSHHRIESPSDGADGDGEGVWSPDIEECFREALQMFPPCGRRKHILQDEGGGKMYGRNELIARHIKMKTGKLRTRKQVSSHIQVLARRKAKAEAAVTGSSNGVSPSPSSIGSGGQPQSASSLRQEEHMQQLHMHLSGAPHSRNHLSNNPSNLNNHQHQQQPQPQVQAPHHPPPAAAVAALCHPATGVTGFYPAGVAASDLWLDRPIVTQKIRLVEFSAFIEHRQPPSNRSALLPATAPHSFNHHQSPFFQPVNHHDVNGHQPASHLSPVMRHNYVHIDYHHQSSFFARHHLSQTRAMLESINIRQIHDKIPGFAGPDGYMQRGSPDAFYLVKFWAELGSGEFDSNMDDQNTCFGFSSHFETIEPYKSLTCSTKACSYGFQVVEKVEKIFGAFNQSNGRYSYNLDRSPMCEFMIQFIKKLRQLPMMTQMNSVLENFTVIQVIESDTLPVPEVLLCLAYVFEVASSEQNNGQPSYHVYKLTKD